MSPWLAEEYEASRTPSAVYWLIGLCVAVYFVQSTLVGDAAMASALGYQPGDLGRRAVWTVVTYMFVHGGLMHLALNLWTLWLFGPRVERAWGPRAFTWFYLWCGIGGWAFHYMFQGSGGTLIGASAAILGIAVAYASLWPDDQVYLFGVVPMTVRWLVLFMAAINIAMAWLDHGSAGGTAYAAHIGGMAAGWLMLRTPNAQSLDRFRSGIASAPDDSDEIPRPVPRGHGRARGGSIDGPPPEGARSSRATDDIVAQSRAAMSMRPEPPTRPAPVPAMTPTAPINAVDAVLDKIGTSGIGSLSAEERLLLDEWSKRLRGGTTGN